MFFLRAIPEEIQQRRDKYEKEEEEDENKVEKAILNSLHSQVYVALV